MQAIKAKDGTHVIISVKNLTKEINMEMEALN
jgi:hypothetical protein